jgi:hypothetical protein
MKYTPHTLPISPLESIVGYTPSFIYNSRFDRRESIVDYSKYHSALESQFQDMPWEAGD